MKDLYTEITNAMIDQLERGIIPWRKPWAGVNTGAVSRATGRPYSLLNQLMLMKPGEYVTFNQCKAEGGTVNKGAKAKVVVFWKVLQCEQRDGNGSILTDGDGKPLTKGIPVLRYFQVFHIDDTTLEPKYGEDNLPNTAQPDERCETILTDYVNREHITLENTLSDKAYYSPALDMIHLPTMEQFAATAEYYSTAFHEATHSTGHRTRLNRFETDSAAAFGSESYSREELVAEIGAAAILHEVGIDTPSSFRNSTAYVQSWLRALKNDKRMIISAAARAEKAVKLILNIKSNQADGE